MYSHSKKSNVPIINTMLTRKLTAALLEDNGAAEFVESLSIETRSVD